MASSRPPSAASGQAAPTAPSLTPRSRENSGSSGRLRRASVTFLETSPPLGVWHATGEVVAKAPTVGDIRRGSFAHGGWTPEGQSDRRKNPPAPAVPSIARPRGARTASGGLAQQEGIVETIAEHDAPGIQVERRSFTNGHIQSDSKATSTEPDEEELAVSPDPITGIYPNGYKFPAKHTWGQSIHIALKGFWRFVTTPLGFVLTVYMANIVGWGGMIFLLLVGAAPAMCTPSCNDNSSPRKIWIEIDSQVLNALFCVTGLGLIPWRFRDLYFLLKWRLGSKSKNNIYLRKLLGINNGWLRLRGSEHLRLHGGIQANNTPLSASDEAVLALPLDKSPGPPLTGACAPPTKLWKLDVVIWMNVWNTFFQIALCYFMWGYNRIERPGWSTATFVAAACGVAAVGGILVFIEGAHVKKVEGIPPDEDEGADAKDAVRVDEEAVAEKETEGGREKV
ncbi:MAG: hypothetical protein M1829_005111 [Trizodia sp. TS-e1964]|nr:MAG: hypothetical protein M1829_005111 [Trizodia sp. TS-e1964]